MGTETHSGTQMFPEVVFFLHSLWKESDSLGFCPFLLMHIKVSVAWIRSHPSPHTNLGLSSFHL